MPRAKTALAAVVALACGCAGAGRRPPHDASEWRELTGEHFVLRTDLPPALARSTLVELERVRSGLLAAAWHGARTPPGKLAILALRDRDELAWFADPLVRGFVTRDLIGERLLVFQAGEGPGLTGLETLKHELAHLIDDCFLLRQPRWLAEGLATFLQTLRLDDAAGVAVLGAPPLEPLQHLAAGGLAPVRELFAWRAMSFDASTADLYATSWLLTHYLLFERGKEFSAFQRRLMRAEDPDAAFRAAAPDLDERALDEALRLHLAERLRARSFPTFQVAVPPWVSEIAEAKIPESEVHAIFATLHLVGAGKPSREAREERAAPELEEAREKDPTNVTALLATRLLELPRAERIARVRAAAQAHPDDWRAQTLLGRVLADEPSAAAEREKALLRAVELSPDNPRTLHDLARARLAAGKAAEAIQLVAHALLSDPASARALETLAAALALAGRCDEARAAQRRALEVVPHDAREQDVRRLEERLERSLARCKGS